MANRKFYHKSKKRPETGTTATSLAYTAEQLGMTGSSVSHQLQILRHARLVRQRRLGKERRYTLASDAVRTMLEAGAQCVGCQTGSE